jgi:predicted transcriptional regulator
MRTATLPPLRVEPDLRARALRGLRAGETLSSFIEEAVRELLDSREAQQEFVRRGLASGAAARRSGVYFSAAEVMASLKRINVRARKRRARRGKASR